MCQQVFLRRKSLETHGVTQYIYDGTRICEHRNYGLIRSIVEHLRNRWAQAFRALFRIGWGDGEGPATPGGGGHSRGVCRFYRAVLAQSNIVLLNF